MAEEKYITQEELNTALSSLKEDLLSSMKQMELEIKSGTNPKLLTEVYSRWFHDTTKDYTENFEKPFRILSEPPYVWKIWEAMRMLTCAVNNSNRVDRIGNPAAALDFCEKLCEFTYNYMENREKERRKFMRIQKQIRITVIPIKDVEGLEGGKEYEVEDIMMGQSNTSVSIVGIKHSYNSVNFKFLHDGKEIDIFASSIINPYKKFTGGNGIVYKEDA